MTLVTAAPESPEESPETRHQHPAATTDGKMEKESCGSGGGGAGGGGGDALWSGTNKNRDVSTGSLTRPFARSLAPLTHSLAPDCSLRSRPLLRSLRSLPRSWESE